MPMFFFPHRVLPGKKHIALTLARELPGHSNIVLSLTPLVPGLALDGDVPHFC